MLAYKDITFLSHFYYCILIGAMAIKWAAVLYFMLVKWGYNVPREWMKTKTVDVRWMLSFFGHDAKLRKHFDIVKVLMLIRKGMFEWKLRNIGNYIYSP